MKPLLVMSCWEREEGVVEATEKAIKLYIPNPYRSLAAVLTTFTSAEENLVHACRIMGNIWNFLIRTRATNQGCKSAD